MQDDKFDLEAFAQSLGATVEQVMTAAETLCELRNVEPTQEALMSACKDMYKHPQIRNAVSPVGWGEWPGERD